MSESADKIYQFLIKCAKAGVVTTYSEVNEVCDFNFPEILFPMRFTPLLTEILKFEAENNRPLLTAILHSSSKGKPGEGFFQTAQGLRKFDPKKSQDYFLENEMNRVFYYWKNNN